MGLTLSIDDSCFIDENEINVGDVNSIRIFNEVNIQEGDYIYRTYQKSKTEIGDRLIIGHNEIVHGLELMLMF